MPDICILDLNMPVLNGWETIKVLTKSWPDIKIMVFSMNINGKNDKVAGAHVAVSKAGGMGDIKESLLRLTQPIEVL